MTASEAPLRSDVRRNRASILDAAARCFASEGVECQVSVIAEQAGVGNATVFRHFPAKQDLVVAVLDRRIAEIQQVADGELRNPDAVAGLRRLLEHLTESLVTDTALREAACTGYFDDAALTERRDLVHADVGRLVERCRTEGTIRPDVSAEDLVVLVRGVAESAGATSWRRYLGLTLLGIVAGSASGGDDRPSARAADAPVH